MTGHDATVARMMAGYGTLPPSPAVLEVRDLHAARQAGRLSRREYKLAANTVTRNRSR